MKVNFDGLRENLAGSFNALVEYVETKQKGDEIELDAEETERLLNELRWDVVGILCLESGGEEEEFKALKIPLKRFEAEEK